ncbi:unnamed protein product [Polarella glacialis]|uniref:Rhodanese domain-containing protein n=1 Tax=Polarella glacialis TaxID=89957 RepID=A0A813INU8_POLGL|nr:unnamed protein product [Polarella glacialis]
MEVVSLPVSEPSVIKGLREPLVIDARDPNEVEGCKGGAALLSSINVPFNVDGQSQSERPTLAADFQAKLEAAGILPEDKSAAIVTHCGSGGRGGKAAQVLRGLGYANAHNGGSADKIRAAQG